MILREDSTRSSLAMCSSIDVHTCVGSLFEREAIWWVSKSREERICYVQPNFVYIRSTNAIVIRAKDNSEMKRCFIDEMSIKIAIELKYYIKNKKVRALLFVDTALNQCLNSYH
jgi:hypothetical protein